MRRNPVEPIVRAIVILLPLLVAGCATTPAPVVDAGAGAPARSGAPDVKQALYGQLHHWQGTRYRMGGLGRKGIDCSGLTYVVYRDLFNTHLPRTTGAQSEVGRSVGRRDLAPGDLVFFKTGLLQRHVGIYIENGMFLHASRSDGVRLSSLASEYWRERYWKARRMDAI